MADVESITQKLCLKYVVAGADIIRVCPTTMPSARAQRKAEGRVLNVLGELQDERKPVGAALVRLAYLRALRASQPGVKLSEDQTVEVDALISELDIALGKLEAETIFAFRRHLRGLKTASTLRAMHTPENIVQVLHQDYGNFPLEQRARASIQSIVQTAATAGALAGTIAGSYDEVPNA